MSSKALKMVPVATLLGAQHYKASTGFSSPNKHRTTIIAILTKSPKKKFSPIIINVCIHRRTVWKTGNYAKYLILLKYRDYYYYYYYYYYKHKISKIKDKKYAVIGVRTFKRKTSGQRSTSLPPRQPNCDKY